MFCAASDSFSGLDHLVRRFYQSFSPQRSAFLSHVQGNVPGSALSGYGSLILNRVLFLRFLQAAGFLNNDPYYLSRHLRQMQCEPGTQTFYRSFFLRLCHEGLNTPASSELLPPFGRLPYLGATLFPPHPLEAPPHHLHIPDQAFSQLFAFLDNYCWRLDDCLPPSESVITPTLLGPVFELYLNQQQAGAYYTREDATSYIARNTISPYLFEKIVCLCSNEKCKAIPIWSILRQKPERYIPAAIRLETMLPGEEVRAYTTRRAYYAALRERLLAGKLSAVDELIICNLDIQQLLVDSIHVIKQPALLHACHDQLRRVTILDPTCGSGAFLLAALDTLTPLYEACFERMQALNMYPDVESASYSCCAVLKQIITSNLYGVDIMEEAIEICRLRLVLRLLSRVRRLEDVEPLPALNTHVCVGNALCEFVPGKYEHTRDSQTPEGFPAREAFSWKRTFPDILAWGGFSVIIGNPPYVTYNKDTFSYNLSNFLTFPCANLYPCVIERCRQLLAPGGWHGMVVPLAAFSTRNMQPFLDGFRSWFPRSWVSFYHFRPSMLFSGGKVASIPTAIYLAKTEGPERRFSTSLLKWTQEQRPQLFSRLTYCQVTATPDPVNRYYYPKFGHGLENTLLKKVLRQRMLREYLAVEPNENRLFYRSAGGLYWKVFVNFPWPYPSTSNKQCSFQEAYLRDVFVAVLNSSLFWWYYTVTCDSFNLKNYMLFGFRFTYPANPLLLEALTGLCQSLMADFQRHARHLKRGNTGSYTIYARKSKPIIDEIDRLLSLHYGFTDQELDFILHYDEHYRLGHAGEKA